MPDCSINQYVELIEPTDCIGDSRVTINNNFLQTDNRICNLINQLQQLSTTLVGMVAYFPANTPPAGWLYLNGQLIQRANYSNLWTFASASNNIVAEATWTSGSTGSFSQGNGTTTFRLPDFRGHFIRSLNDTNAGVGPSRFVGGAPQAPYGGNFTARGIIGPGDNAAASGAIILDHIYWNDDPKAYYHYQSETATVDVKYGDTRPSNIALLPCIKY